MKNILIINGHPSKESFNYALSTAYLEGVKTTGEPVSILNIADLNFSPSLTYGYQKRTELEPDLLDAIEKIKQATHIVWVFPTWWAGIPAILKGFIDRCFLPGITFQPVDNKPFPIKLLKGKTARLIITSDSPRWYDYLYLKSPVINQMKKGVLNFCGIQKVKTTYLSPIKSSTSKKRTLWLQKVKQLGVALK